MNTDIVAIRQRLTSIWLAGQRRAFIFCGGRICRTTCMKALSLLLNGLSHEIFGPVFWPVWLDLGLNMNRFWFLSFNEAPSIWDRHFKFWCVSCQTFSEILRISEKDWQLNPRFSEIYLNCKLLWDTLMLWKNILGEPRTQLPILLQELGTRLPIFFRDFKNLREIFTP